MAPEQIRTDVNSLVIQNLGNPTLDTTTSTYTVYGMPLAVNTLSLQIENSFNYVSDLMGSTNMADPNFANRLKGFIADYATLRILASLAGISIPTHFNYTAAGLNIQKPVVSQIRQLLDAYLYSCKRWQTILLSRYKVGKQTDLNLILINEKLPIGSGITQIGYDAQSV